jgi:KDO2-lipid IV(A) lauroyltransferase
MYYLVFAICYVLSLLPLGVLYLLSDVAYLVLYRVVGYRTGVVTDNLARALGELPEAERRRIIRAFYRNLADMLAETIKLFSIPERALARRFTGDLTLLRELEASGRSYQIHLGHYFNWEWANLYIRSQVRAPFLVTYMPLKSPLADRLVRRLRGRTGSVLVSARDVAREMKPWQHAQHISVLVADQNPGKARRAYWFRFLGRMTPFYKGPELSARRGDHPVVYGEISKTGRGRYHITVSLVSDHPAQEPPGAVTGTFVRMLEAGIRAQPENWVWSHRRWKRAWDGTGEAPSY